MDMNEYCLHAMVKERIAQLRVDIRAAELRAAGRSRQPLRVALGHLLVRLGNRLLADLSPARAAA